MAAFGSIIGSWNAFALVLGLIGLARRDLRPKLALIAGRQARAVLALSFVTGLAGIGGAIVVPSLLGLVTFAIGFWFLGGIFPFTVAVFLRAAPRDED